MTHPSTRLTRLAMLAGVGLLGWMVAPDLVHATAQSMPWETPLDTVVKSLTGPVAKAAGILSIFIFGIGMAFSEGGGLRVILGIVFGLSIAFAAASWGITFFGFAGGAVF